jgi:hypothetical protein
VKKRRVREVKMKELRRCVNKEPAREQVAEKNREDNTKLPQIGNGEIVLPEAGFGLRLNSNLSLLSTLIFTISHWSKLNLSFLAHARSSTQFQ